MKNLSGHGRLADGDVKTPWNRPSGRTFRATRAQAFFRSSLVQTLFYGIFSG